MHSNAVRSAAPLRDEALILVDETTHTPPMGVEEFVKRNRPSFDL